MSSCSPASESGSSAVGLNALDPGAATAAPDPAPPDGFRFFSRSCRSCDSFSRCATESPSRLSAAAVGKYAFISSSMKDVALVFEVREF